MNCSLPGSSLHGILPARILEWGAISLSRGSSRPGDWTRFHISCIGRGVLYPWATLLLLCLVAQSCPTLCDPWTVAHQVPLSAEILQAKAMDWVAMPSSRASSQPRDLTQVSHIAGNSLPSEPQGKPKNTGVSNLSLLQGIFTTQESNQSLLHCRWILYQLRYQGSPLSIPIVNMLQISHACWLIATVSIHWSVIPLEPNPVSGLLLPH